MKRDIKIAKFAFLKASKILSIKEKLQLSEGNKMHVWALTGPVSDLSTVNYRMETWSLLGARNYHVTCTRH